MNATSAPSTMRSRRSSSESRMDRLRAVLRHPGVEVAIGFGADVAAGEQLLQRPARTVGQLADVTVEPGPALVRGAAGLVDLGERGEPRIVGRTVGHMLCASARRWSRGGSQQGGDRFGEHQAWDLHLAVAPVQ